MSDTGTEGDDGSESGDFFLLYSEIMLSSFR